MDSSRPAPSVPPAYTRFSRYAQNKSMRTPVMLLTIGAFVWFVVVGVDYIRDSKRDGLSGRLSTMLLVQGILFLALAAFEAFGFYVAYKATPKLGRIYSVAIVAGAAVLIANEVMRLVVHFVFKSDIIAYCVLVNQGDSSFVSSADLQDWCNRDWGNGTWRDIAWLVFAIICGVCMYVLVRAFYCQMQDPNFGRTVAPSEQYRLDTMSPYPGSSPYGQHIYAPPYAAPAGYTASQGQPPLSTLPEYQGPAPAYMEPEKGTAVPSDSKQELEATDLRDHIERPISGYHAERSEDLPGRQGEGRV